VGKKIMTTLGPYELNQIYTGDARELSKSIPDESVDLIFTDPVYENLEDYEWLGETAVRILKPDSACLAWVKTSLHDNCKKAMESAGLTYRYTLFYTCIAKESSPISGGIFPWTTPCLYFTKGKRPARPFIPDTYTSQTMPAGGFKWNKNPGVLEKWLGSFSKFDDVVFDPFSGSGSLPLVCKKASRSFLAFEIDGKRAAEARERVERAVWLPIGEPEYQQGSFEL
jgi:hypothetical protein